MTLFPTGHATHPQWRMAAALVLAQLRAQMALPAYAAAPTLGLLYITDHYANDARELLDYLASELPEVTDWSGTVGVGVSANNQRETGVDEGATELRLGRVVGIEVQRCRVLRQQREPDVVLLGEGAPESVSILVAHFEVFIEPAAPAFLYRHAPPLLLAARTESSLTQRSNKPRGTTAGGTLTVAVRVRCAARSIEAADNASQRCFVMSCLVMREDSIEHDGCDLACEVLE